MFFFVGISFVIILLSFFTSSRQSEIRKVYIRQHRTTLLILVLMWVCPIWANINLHFVEEDDNQFSVINILAFFCIVSSSGIIVLTRIVFDSYLRKKVPFPPP